MFSTIYTEVDVELLQNLRRDGGIQVLEHGGDEAWV